MNELRDTMETDDRTTGLETEVRQLRTEIRPIHVSLWLLVVAALLLIGLRDIFGPDFWRSVFIVAVLATPVIAIVSILRWMFSPDVKEARPSPAERMNLSKLDLTSSSSRGA